MNRSLTKRIAWKASFLAFMMLGIFSSNSLKADNIVIGSYVQQQSITVQQKLTIKELFKLIETQTDFDFFYSSSLNELENKVDLNLVNTTVDVVLETAFTDSDLEFTIKDKDVMIRKNPNSADQQQTKTVTGVVKDERGDTLPGASVVVKGSTTGTSTDFDGNFSIEATEGETLVFSFMGYTDSEVVVGAQNVYDVNMQPSSNVLDEIIVSGVASGTSKKKMSVSVVKINADALNQVPQSNISSSLQGKVAGVTITTGSGSPGSGSSIVLRGATQLQGSQAPMIMIDGIIMEGSLADINVDDIESMEVVKGAAASSLYGSRAANGVIVIMSKRGSKQNSGKTTVTLRNEIGMQQIAKKIDVATHHNYLLADDWKNYSTFTKYAEVDYPDGYVTGWNADIEGKRSDVTLPNGMMTQPYAVVNDAQDVLLTKGLSYTNFVGVASRINQTNLYVSFENNSSNGILVETGGYKRQSFRVNVDHSITDRIKISASNSYIMTNNDMADSEYQAFRQALMMEPDADLLRDNENGQPYNFKPNHWNELSDNPLYDLHYRERASHKNRYMGNYEVNVAMFDWMSFKASYSIESQDYERRTYSPKGMYDGFSDGDYVLEVGQLGRVRDKTFNQNFRATLAFNKSWENVDFNGKISYLGEDYFRLINNLYGDNFELSDYPSFSVIDDSNKRFTEQIYETRAENYFAIASFVVKDRYIFDALIRQDISSRFGEDNRSNIYYRGSAAYRLTQDIEIPGVQEMKLRTAIGTAGIRPGYSYQYETYNRNKGVYTKSTLGNKDLKPSLSTEVEIGLDIAFLDRFTGEFTFSNTVTEDQFVQVDLLSHAGGFPSQWQNAATMESKTFEAMLNAKILDAKDWRWDLTFTFDNTRTTITELDVPERKVGPGKTFYLREGELYGTMYGNGFVKSLDQMQSQLADGDDISNYEVNSEGYVVRAGTQATVNEKPITILDSEGNKKYMKIGDINPDFRMGISSTLSYKGLSFYMLWRWKHGGDVYNKTSQNMVRDRRLGMMDQYGKNPEEMKTVGYYDGFYNGGAASKFWVEDGSYLKLGEASLRYSLKSNNLGALGKYINSVDFGLIGRNLLMFADYTGFDPEVTSSGYIYDDMGYPNFRSYSFSLGIKF